MILLLLISLTIPTWAKVIQFPKEFKWCVATAAHQIEGNNKNSDHYQWETEQKDRVISQKILRQNNIRSFTTESTQCPIISKDQDPDPLREHSILFRNQNKFSICEYSGKSTDHWNRTTEDIELLRKLNVNWYRFSIEWAKIEPQKNHFDQNAIDHYKNEIRELLKFGIQPHITLFHFTMPKWLRDEGGWETLNSPIYFSRFAKNVYEELASAGLFVPVWYTFNEPMVHIAAGYLMALLPPGEIKPSKIPKVIDNILKAHALAYHQLHDLGASTHYHQNNLRVGIAHHLRVFDAYSDEDSWAIEKAFSQVATQLIDYIWNWMFIDAIETGRLFKYFSKENKFLKGTQDFLGLNYYSRDRVKVNFKNFRQPITLLVDPNAIKHGNITDMGWEIYPKGLYDTIKILDDRVQKYGKRRLPILISENGIADEKDSKRILFLKDHLRFLNDALNEGIPIEGYCYWSLLDNFEWNSGYYPQFGLYSVDFFKTLNRTPRKSALFFSEIAKTQKFTY